MKRDPRKFRAWRRRSNPLARRTRLKAGRIGRAWKQRKRKGRIRRRPQPTTGFRLWVLAQEACCVPGCSRGEPDPHHVSAKGMGGGDPWELDRANVAPLCRRHHQLGDSPGWSWQRFQQELDVDLEAVALALWRRWEAVAEKEREAWDLRAYRLNRRRGVPKAEARRKAS